MEISALIAPGPIGRIATDPDPAITQLTADSRQVRPGALFVALNGARADGRAFIDDALARGAAAILTDPETAARLGPMLPVPVISDPEPRRRLALMAARFYPGQPATIVAVTGTNGKSSTVGFTRQIWTAAGQPAAALGTLGVERPEGLIPGSMTTPDPVTLHATLADLARDGIDHVAMEASSHGLDQFRLDGVRLKAAAFTNLTQDHLDYHGTMAAYLAAKRRLFTEVMAPGGTAVLNADIAEFADLAAAARAAGQAVVDFGRAAQAIRLVEAVPTGEGQRLTLELDGRPATVDLPLIGSFQAMNALAALGLGLATGVPEGQAIEALHHLTGVRGRLEWVARLPNGAQIFVDYAHTPDGLDKVLTALRPHTAGRLVAVFGAGGDRDPTKRPRMGAVVAALADRAIITDDNPRSEDPATIRAAIAAACPGAAIIGDRAAAIAAAIAGLEAGDVLVLAGKGHEQGQIVGDQVLPFDDAAVARAIIAGAEPRP